VNSTHIALQPQQQTNLVRSKTFEPIAEINAAHRQAQTCAADAIRHAIRCGELLLESKKGLAHGEFMKWLEVHCIFKYATAARYMKAAKQYSTGVEISSLSSLFASGRPGAKRIDSRPAVSRREVKKHQVETVVVPATSVSIIGSATPPPLSIDVEQAIKLMRASGVPTAVGPYRILKGQVTRLRNQLAQAEEKLAAMESAIITAARECAQSAAS
jgi:Protein of unknown function (DUF3102)